jgi:thiamine-monophosphate kinase
VAALADLPGLGAVIDISDGLAGDLAHVLRASGVGAEVTVADVPVDPLLDQLPESLAARRLELVLGGGEDFELLLTAPADVSQRLEALGCRRVGRIVEGQALVYYDANGRPLDIDVSGYSHM